MPGGRHMYANTVPGEWPGRSGQQRHYVNLNGPAVTLIGDARAPGRQRGTASRAGGSRLLRYAWAAAPGGLAATVGLGLAGTALILAQAGLLAHALATAARGSGTAAALGGTLLALLAVVMARAAVTDGGEVAALRAAATVKSRLRRALADRSVRLGPVWLGGQRAGEIAALATRGLDGLDSYFARYLPQLVLAVAVPIAVLFWAAAADWISAVVIGVTLPLIPVFAVLVGLAHQGSDAAAVAVAGHALRALPRRGGGTAHPQGVRPRQGAGKGDREGHRRAPDGHHVDAPGGVLVRPGTGADRRGSHRAGRGRGGAAAAVWPPGI